ncbi:MAG: SIMPL domain-containing protein [Alistipes sp.]|jgi:uncharacterized protein YggE|nr:SIMPL domain-containing protein [Alistipes sp.]
MKRLFIALVALTFALPVFAQEEENYIQVNGTSEMEIVPNQFYLSITLDEGDTKGKQAIELQRKQMIAVLKALGIDTEKQLTMADMSSSYFKRGTSLSIAKYQLLLSTTEQVVSVYDKLSEIGISDIDISRVSHTDMEQFKSKCRQDAMKNAKAIATELATAVGQTIGSCIYIYDSNRGITPSYYNDGIMLMRSVAKISAEMAEEPTPVEFKKITINYSVTAKFRLNE